MLQSPERGIESKTEFLLPWVSQMFEHKIFMPALPKNHNDKEYGGWGWGDGSLEFSPDPSLFPGGNMSN